MLGLVLASVTFHAPQFSSLAHARPRPRMSLVSQVAGPVVGAIVPPDLTCRIRRDDLTPQNLITAQALGLGAWGLLAPDRVISVLWGATPSPATIAMMRAISLISLNLGGILAKDDADTAAFTGFLSFGLWWRTLSLAAASGAFAPHSLAIAGVSISGSAVVGALAVQTVMCAKRGGGLFTKVTEADTNILSALLPRDYNKSLRNFVGFQMLFYAFTGLFRPTHYVSSVLGLSKITPLVSALTMALGASQLCLASRILGGDEKQAAATGVSFFGGWAAVIRLANKAGAWAMPDWILLECAVSAGVCLLALTK